jgi:transcriptional regulator with XRE-family HTH domain
MERARQHVPEVIRTFMRVRGVSQEEIGFALGLTQRQMSRRLNVPGAISQEELAGIASFFDVEVATFYKSLPDAVADLLSRIKRWIDQAA